MTGDEHDEAPSGSPVLPSTPAVDTTAWITTRRGAPDTDISLLSGANELSFGSGSFLTGGIATSTASKPPAPMGGAMLQDKEGLMAPSTPLGSHSARRTTLSAQQNGASAPLPIARIAQPLTQQQAAPKPVAQQANTSVPASASNGRRATATANASTAAPAAPAGEPFRFGGLSQTKQFTFRNVFGTNTTTNTTNTNAGSTAPRPRPPSSSSSSSQTFQFARPAPVLPPTRGPNNNMATHASASNSNSTPVVAREGHQGGPLRHSDSSAGSTPFVPRGNMHDLGEEDIMEGTDEVMAHLSGAIDNSNSLDQVRRRVEELRDKSPSGAPKPTALTADSAAGTGLPVRLSTAATPNKTKPATESSLLNILDTWAAAVGDGNDGEEPATTTAASNAEIPQGKAETEAAPGHSSGGEKEEAAANGSMPAALSGPTLQLHPATPTPTAPSAETTVEPPPTIETTPVSSSGGGGDPNDSVVIAIGELSPLNRSPLRGAGSNLSAEDAAPASGSASQQVSPATAALTAALESAEAGESRTASPQVFGGAGTSSPSASPRLSSRPSLRQTTLLSPSTAHRLVPTAESSDGGLFRASGPPPPLPPRADAAAPNNTTAAAAPAPASPLRAQDLLASAAGDLRVVASSAAQPVQQGFLHREEKDKAPSAPRSSASSAASSPSRSANATTLTGLGPSQPLAAKQFAYSPLSPSSRASAPQLQQQQQAVSPIRVVPPQRATQLLSHTSPGGERPVLTSKLGSPSRLRPSAGPQMSTPLQEQSMGATSTRSREAPTANEAKTPARALLAEMKNQLDDMKNTIDRTSQRTSRLGQKLQTDAKDLLDEYDQLRGNLQMVSTPADSSRHHHKRSERKPRHRSHRSKREEKAAVAEKPEPSAISAEKRAPLCARLLLFFFRLLFWCCALVAALYAYAQWEAHESNLRVVPT